jgi:L-ascorbate metabolism protein UlaG (beta-lactamase superfamily)
MTGPDPLTGQVTQPGPDPSGATDRLFFIGTATVLLRVAGVTVLTDPNFLHRGEFAHLGWGLSSRRLTEPALRVDQLPPLDLVVLSHLHGDHFDRRARHGLDRSAPIVTTPHAARWLGRYGFLAPHGLDTWESWEHRSATGAGVRVTSVPAEHAAGPVLRRLIPPVMGSVLEFTAAPGARPYQIYVTGDTLLRPRLHEIFERYPRLDLAVVHLGGTRIGPVLLTMDGEQGARLLERMPGTTRVVPVHHDDYGVFRSPLRDFLAAAARRGLSARVLPVGRGETVPLPPASGGDPY